MWAGYNVPPIDVTEVNTVHAADMFCPDWQLGINDQVMIPDVAQSLCLGAVLPRDLKHSQGKDDVKLVEDLLCSRAAESTSLADLIYRFRSLSKKEKEFKAKMKQMADKAEKAEKARMVAEVELKKASISRDSLQTALDEANKCLEGVNDQIQNEVAFARMTAVAEYKASEEFQQDLVALSTPNYKFGFTAAMQKIRALAPETFDSLNLDEEKSYDSEAEDLAELCLQGMVSGKRVTEVTEGFYDLRRAENEAGETADAEGSGGAEVMKGTSETANPEEVTGTDEAREQHDSEHVIVD